MSKIRLNNKFQFQTGAIRRLSMTDKQRIMECFNSKLVRLEVFSLSRNSFRLYKFQFQTGAIRRLAKMLSTDPIQFQFQTGAIRSLPQMVDASTFAVSIPNWCD